MLTSVLVLALPVLPASLLVASLRSKRVLDPIAPLQFAILIGSAIMAVKMEHPTGQIGALLAMLIAIAGLVAAVLRTDSIARRALYSFDWERFELDFHFYVLTAEWLGS